ncbi:MAG TPA: error-prone DNA polymerase [Acetobacteraceae bacterium]|nr:error-prone DNA polymerase [Acetobacteraceae bacterium]
MPYIELDACTGFSFLHGASLAEELVATASVLGMPAIGIADRNTVAGLVRAHEAARQVGIRPIVGSRLVFRDGTPDLICYPTDRAAWGRLTRLLTVGKSRVKKGACALDAADLADHGDGQIALVVPPERLDDAFRDRLIALRGLFGSRIHLTAQRRHRADDARRLRALAELAQTCRMPMVATNAVLYHVPQRRELQDVMACIRMHTTIDKAGRALEANAERHLKTPQEMARLFHAYPGAIERTEEIAASCRFALDELAYEYPDEPIPPDTTPDEHLAALTWAGAARRFPAGVPDKLRETLEKELALIARLDYARYFLTVHDIVRFARERDILCQGRGSAANSAVCFCLGVTGVDPTQIDLLFERFVSAERREPPDIDVDFEHERREEVIQYVYERYGRHRAGIAATVIHYRPKMAAREVGKAMGLSEDATAALSMQTWNAAGELWPDDRLREIGLDPESDVVRRTVTLARELVGFPRHLSQHVGGFVLTRGRLDETVPIGPAAMKDRSFIEWDKDDIDTLGIMKVDVLALGMLTCIRKAFELLRKHGIRQVNDLAEIPREDPVVYEMLQRADSLGVFQVESRAQMSMLPRLKPREFYDLVIEVAIVRPGPIQGDMVHPYLRRRAGKEEVFFPSPDPAHGLPDELRRVLGRTLGVPLFQEQAMRIAIDAAGFTPEEANQLRRAMATFRHVGTIHKFFTKMVEGMVRRGYDRDFAERCFRQIEGFGTYGFPESHAASFAHLVYVSSWLKCHHPATFACALLNSQPMGFYAPAQIVRDAREHGVSVRGVDVLSSEWDCTLEAGAALRLGFRQIGGFREDWAEGIETARANGRCADLDAMARAGVPRAALEALAEADALRGIGLDRRAGLWQVRGLRDEAALPLLADLDTPARPVALPLMQLPEHVVADYQTTGLSLKAHPMRFLRAMLQREGLRTCAETMAASNGTKARVAGIVLVRQRPGSAAGVVFATIEDETGITNVVIWPSLIERFRREVVGAALLDVEGRVQRSEEGVVHLVAEKLRDRTEALRQIDDSGSAAGALARADEMPPVLPRSRDFH